MNLVLMFHLNISLASESSVSQREPSVLLKSDDVSLPLNLKSKRSESMTTIQSLILISFFVGLDTERCQLVFRFLTLEGALGIDSFCHSWKRKVFGAVGGCIVHSPEHFMFVCMAAYAFSFCLPDNVEPWWDHMGSVSNDSGPSLRVRVRVQNEPL